MPRGQAIAAAGIVAGLAAWSAGSAWFILARDDIAQRVFVGETGERYAYEDRIKRLEDELRREVTRNLVEKDGMTLRISRLAGRQAEIEAQQTRLEQLAPGVSPTVTGSIGPARASVTERATAAAPDLGLRLGRDSPTEPDGRPSDGVSAPMRDHLSVIERSVETVNRHQIALLGRMRDDVDRRTSSLRAALGASGLKFDRIAPGSSAVGGPLVPLTADAMPSGAFGALSGILESARADYERLIGVAHRLPFGRPLLGELEPTSPFGVRLDPFTRAPALHTGIDFRAELGTPVRTTASGRVTVAEWSSGYGNLVEIDHGNGLATRYGHLSAFLVAPGETVTAGQVVGRVGSTGRSTGTHLHYETRIDGEPVDPVRFLQAGRAVAAAMP